MDIKDVVPTTDENAVSEEFKKWVEGHEYKSGPVEVVVPTSPFYASVWDHLTNDNPKKYFSNLKLRLKNIKRKGINHSFFKLENEYFVVYVPVKRKFNPEVKTKMNKNKFTFDSFDLFFCSSMFLIKERYLRKIIDKETYERNKVIINAVPNVILKKKGSKKYTKLYILRNLTEKLYI